MTSSLNTRPIGAGWLSAERAVAEELLPGFDKLLADAGVELAESKDFHVVRRFRDAGGGNLLLPTALGGLGASCADAVRFQRAMGSRSPSLAVATTMHHFKVAWLARELDSPALDALLGKVAENRWLIASCGAEGTVGGTLFTPGTTVRTVPGGLRLSGIKRPCSLVWSMGLLSMLVAGPDDSPYRGKLVNVLVPADAPGVTPKAFWGNEVLSAAETDSVELADVFVPDEHVVVVGSPAASAPVITSNMTWFSLLITAAYLGVASGLVERLVLGGRGDAVDRVAAAGPLETAMAAVEGLAGTLDTGGIDDDLFARALMVRYGAQRAIAEATDRALDLLGGMSFAAGGEPASVLAASRALAFHPPSESSMREPLAEWLRGGILRLS